MIQEGNLVPMCHDVITLVFVGKKQMTYCVKGSGITIKLSQMWESADSLMLPKQYPWELKNNRSWMECRLDSLKKQQSVYW